MKLILVVDRNDDVLEVTTQALSYYGYIVETLNDYKVDKVIEKVQNILPNLVILDYPVDGKSKEIVDFLNTNLPAIPVVLFTTLSEKDAETAFDDLNVAGYILKPFDLKTLSSIVKRHSR